MKKNKLLEIACFLGKYSGFLMLCLLFLKGYKLASGQTTRYVVPLAWQLILPAHTYWCWRELAP